MVRDYYEKYSDDEKKNVRKPMEISIDYGTNGYCSVQLRVYGLKSEEAEKFLIEVSEGFKNKQYEEKHNEC